MEDITVKFEELSSVSEVTFNRSDLEGNTFAYKSNDIEYGYSYILSKKSKAIAFCLLLSSDPSLENIPNKEFNLCIPVGIEGYNKLEASDNLFEIKINGTLNIYRIAIDISEKVDYYVFEDKIILIASTSNQINGKLFNLLQKHTSPSKLLKQYSKDDLFQMKYKASAPSSMIDSFTRKSTQSNQQPLTNAQFAATFTTCKEVFTKKMQDYGLSWLVLRPSSLTDQIYIKVKRIRSIEEIGSQKVEDDVQDDYIGVINYCIMALIQLGSKSNNLEPNKVASLYNQHQESTLELMKAKNHDYGEAWRDMRVSSITDLILMKILRIKQIEDNNGIVSNITEGLSANYQDIINYAVFSLIKIKELDGHSENEH